MADRPRSPAQSRRRDAARSHPRRDQGERAGTVRGLCRRGERFPLPARDEERIAIYRAWVRWEDLKEPAAFGQSSDAVRWLPPGMQEQLEALEARLAEELRGGS